MWVRVPPRAFHFVQYKGDIYVMITYVLVVVLVMFGFWMAKCILDWMIEIAQRDMHIYDPDWRVRWMFRELPKNLYIENDEAKEIATDLLIGFPGEPNGAITHYLTGLSSIKVMEDRLNSRAGLWETRFQPKSREFL